MPEVRERGPMAAVGSTAIAKVVVMGMSGALAIFTSRLIIEHFGTDAYVQYGLLAAIPALLPFADLGVATVVVNTVAGSRDPESDESVRRTIATAVRILVGSAAVIMAVVAVISVLGRWDDLLGDGLMEASGHVAAPLCMVVFALTLPLTVGQRVLVGLRRTTMHVASQAVVAPFIFASVLLGATLSLPIGGYLAVLSYVGSALVSIVCLVLTARLLSSQLWGAFADVPRLRAKPGVPVMNTAWPMLVQMVALPIGMQTDRLLLSHAASSDELASYNLAAQLFAIVLQTISTAGVALWPIYARARADETIESPMRPAGYFLAGGLVLGLGVAALSPWLVDFIAGDAIVIDGWLVGSFVVFAALQASKYPIGMYMTDARGLRFQVLPILLMVPLNVAASWWLIGRFGAAGAIMGSVIGVAVCQVVPNLLYVRRDLDRRRSGAVAAVSSGR